MAMVCGAICAMPAAIVSCPMMRPRELLKFSSTVPGPQLTLIRVGRGHTDASRHAGCLSPDAVGTPMGPPRLAQPPAP